MESSTIMMEGGEWTSFNGVSVNEEADFMAKMFPKSSFNNGLEMSSSQSLSSSFYSGNEPNIRMSGDDSSSFYSNDSNSNLYSLSQGSSLSSQCNEIYFLSDPDQFLAVNNNESSLPVGFCLDTKGCIQAFPGNSIERNHRLNVQIGCNNLDGLEMDLKQPQKSQLSTKLEMEEVEPNDDDRSSDLLEHRGKRSRNSEVEKGKRNARSKRSRKPSSDDDDNSHALNKQISSSCISEELSGGYSNVSTIDNRNVKTRASRGSAIDPQSLYARKRRERINERLKILQSLIPNGTKVDISTMLEEAVNYVKFLELQIKLLSSDDLWMFAPLAYNGMDIGLDAKINSLLQSN